MALALPVTPAHAVSPVSEIFCAPRAEMEQKLHVLFGSRRIGSGMRDESSMMELWTSERTGDWTMVLSYADGRSCVVAIGEAWDATPPTPRDPA